MLFKPCDFVDECRFVTKESKPLSQEEGAASYNADDDF